MALVLGSMRVTESSPRFTTQSAPSPNASATGRRPTLIRPDGPSSNVVGLKRCTVASPAFATQTEPPPTTTAAGMARRARSRPTHEPPGRMRASVESPKTAQT